MTSPSSSVSTFSAPLNVASICIPPALTKEAMQKAEEQFHPAWSKGVKRGKHFVITTDNLDDLSEIADFARCELEEPEQKLTKTRRAACQALLDRTHRYAVLEPLGPIHCLAVAWREKPLQSGKCGSMIMRQLRKQSGFMTS